MSDPKRDQSTRGETRTRNRLESKVNRNLAQVSGITNLTPISICNLSIISDLTDVMLKLLQEEVALTGIDL